MIYDKELDREMSDIYRAYRCARYLRGCGLIPLPSQSGKKCPAMATYSHVHHGGNADDRLTSETWAAVNIQVVCGTRSGGEQKIMVVDCDGPRAIEVWSEMLADHDCDIPTWRVLSGSGGIHHYYRIPDDVESLPSGLVWGVWDTWGSGSPRKPGWVPHERIDLLADGSLAVTPPSRHVSLGVRYKFMDGPDPRTMPILPEAPEWAMTLPRYGTPKFPHQIQADYLPRRPKYAPGETIKGKPHPSRNGVLDLIHDKAALAQSWGLRFSGRSANAKGWVECYAVNRDEVNPSGSFNPNLGVYMDMRDRNPVSLFDLGVELGVFPTWLDALMWCAEQFDQNLSR